MRSPDVRLTLFPVSRRWLDGHSNRHTRRAYRGDLVEFVTYQRIDTDNEFRSVTREHLLRWLNNLERRKIAEPTQCRKLAALSSLFDYLLKAGVTRENPAKCIRRPSGARRVKTRQALTDAQSQALLRLPLRDDVRDARDRALLSVLLNHGLTRSEVSLLKVSDMHNDHLRVRGRNGNSRLIPLHPDTLLELRAYLRTHHERDAFGPLFLPIRNNRTGVLDRALTPDGIYKIVRRYLRALGIDGGAHVMRATAAMQALACETDVAHVQRWLGHTSISATHKYMRTTK